MKRVRRSLPPKHTFAVQGASTGICWICSPEGLKTVTPLPVLALAENAGRVMSRDALMDRVKGEPLEAFDRSIDVHVSRIRQALEDDPKHPRRILTVRGAGYVFARAQD